MSVHETYLSTIWTLCRTCQCSPVSKFGRLALHLVGRCKSSLIGQEWQLKRSCVYESLQGIPQSRTATLLDIKAALEFAGIEFIGTPEDRPGIRVELRKLDSK